MLLPMVRQIREGGEPFQRKSSKYSLDGFPLGLLHPTCLFFFERLYSSFIIPDSRHLGTKHNRSEQSKQKSFKQEKEDEHNSCRWRICCTRFPISVNASDEVVYSQEQT